MVVAWIVITLMIALVVGVIAAGVSGEGFAFVMGFMWTVGLSFWIGVIYVAAHFIGKYW